jgi:hypothetical protein
MPCSELQQEKSKYIMQQTCIRSIYVEARDMILIKVPLEVLVKFLWPFKGGSEPAIE